MASAPLKTRDEPNTNQPPFWPRLAAVLGLFFLAPLTAEYLIGYLDSTGNFPLLLVGLLFLAPLYGGAALIIREITRRTGRGWLTISWLSFAFGVFQAGLIDHSLFNLSFLDIAWWDETLTPTYIPGLGISGYFALTFITGHMIWSIGLPIVIVEAFVPTYSRTPWLGNFGLTVTVILYLLASAFIFMDMRQQEQFLPSVGQFIGAGAVVIGSVIGAFMVGRRPRPTLHTPAPKPWLVGIVTFFVLSLPTLLEVIVHALGGDPTFAVDWRGVGLTTILYVGLALLLWHWSQHQDWRSVHILAFAGGALLTRAWIAFLVEPALGDVALYDKLIHNVVFALGAVVLLILAARSLHRQQRVLGENLGYNGQS